MSIMCHVQCHVKGELYYALVQCLPGDRLTPCCITRKELCTIKSCSCFQLLYMDELYS